MAGKNHVDFSARVVGGGHGGGSHVTYIFAGSVVEREHWIAKKVTQKSN